MANYEDVKAAVKERDGAVCQRGCGKGSIPVHFRVVRKKFWEPDSLENCEVVCKWCCDKEGLD